MKLTESIKNEIAELYGRLEGIANYLEKTKPNAPRKEVVDNYGKVLARLSSVSGTDLLDFEVPQNAFYNGTVGFDTVELFCSRDLFEPKIIELLHYLRKRYPFIEQGNQPIDVRGYLVIREKIGSVIDFLKGLISK